MGSGEFQNRAVGSWGTAFDLIGSQKNPDITHPFIIGFQLPIESQRECLIRLGFAGSPGKERSLLRLPTATVHSGAFRRTKNQVDVTDPNSKYSVMTRLAHKRAFRTGSASFPLETNPKFLLPLAVSRHCSEQPSATNNRQCQR